MTAADLGERTAARPLDSGPVAEVSRGALRANAALLETLPSPLRLPADAWGHGVATVAAAVRDAADTGMPSSDRAPSPRDVATLLGLPGGDERARPAMRLVGRVLSTKTLRRGEGVSYGFAFRAPVDTRVALVTGGYAQGVVRALGNRASLSVDAVSHPIVGRVAMDVCVIDIGTARIERGAEAVFFGDPGRGEPALGAWTDATGLTASELVTAVGLHAQRRDVA